ncbi:MAG: ABC transporter substrate-binding protein, partial [Raoultella planticola]
RFIQFLLSPEGQQALSDTNTGKYSIIPDPGNTPRARQQRQLLSEPSLNYQLILQRQRLVQKLFDTAISFRLSQLKDAWRALHNAEARLKTPLPEVRALLTAMPVSEQQSRDEDYLRQLDNKDRAEQLMMEWQLFFQEQQRQAIVKLENLK